MAELDLTQMRIDVDNIIDGNTVVPKSASSTQLEYRPRIKANLSSNSATEFVGNQNIEVGVGGILPIANGGTGANSAEAARDSLQLGVFATKDVLDSSDIPSFDASKITSGVLPLSQGGTGATTASGVRKSLGLGNTTGALPIANGGTGATTKDSALQNLGIGKGGTPWTKLWTGTLSKGQAITVSNFNKYRMFGVRTGEKSQSSADNIMLIGVVTPIDSPTQLHCSSALDNGTSSFVVKASFKISGNSVTLTSASSHSLNENGNTGITHTVREIWGLL